MKRRQTKKLLKNALNQVIAPKQDIETLVGEVFSLLYKVNAETPFCCFGDFSGHVNKLDIHISKTKEGYSKRATEAVFYLGGTNGKETDLTYWGFNPADKLLTLRDNLLYILEHKKLPYDNMRVVTVESEEYRLV